MGLQIVVDSFERTLKQIRSSLYSVVTPIIFRIHDGSQSNTEAGYVPHVLTAKLNFLPNRRSQFPPSLQIRAAQVLPLLVWYFVRSIEQEVENDVGYGRRVRGHGPRRGEDPEAREAERSREEENPGAQKQDCFYPRPTGSPPIRVQYLRGPHPPIPL